MTASPHSLTRIAPLVADSLHQLRDGWYGYQISVAGYPSFAVWVQAPDVQFLGDGYISREAQAEQFADGSSIHDCGAPHPDAYYDALWDRIIRDVDGRTVTT